MPGSGLHGELVIVHADAYSPRPSAPQDIFYVALGVVLAMTAWYEKRLL